MKKSSKYTIAGTNIDEVKQRNASSGLSYNEALTLLAQTSGYSSNTIRFPKGQK
ncbi:hypothetical protein [Lottiidibacillus patelloidae]|uniref:hypothetical protein n=1 Tax=Lottiidibacillus patelloidae TaxID=2670334 RepID=UPI0018E9CEB1|nr:hypothetical protein [Lottiidibacillus patelloidae]